MKSILSKKYFDETSLIPMQAVFEGRQDLGKAFEEMNVSAGIVALVAPLFVW